MDVQVKTDNQDIAGMERRLVEIAGEIASVQEQMDSFDEAPAPDDEEKRAKYMELLKREGEMQTFLGRFGAGDTRIVFLSSSFSFYACCSADEYDANFESEKVCSRKVAAAAIMTQSFRSQARLTQAQQQIVALLEHTSRTVAQSGQLPSAVEHENLKEDLAFKAHEMEKSQATAESLFCRELVSPSGSHIKSCIRSRVAAGASPGGPRERAPTRGQNCARSRVAQQQPPAHARHPR
jgi:hypothetical protein